MEFYLVRIQNGIGRLTIHFKSFILDAKGIDLIVKKLDSFFTNHSLVNVFEIKIGDVVSYLKV
ncbi:hypothetical protein LZ575_09440 [Antarcticibacterium sp. 1MA-6-2]|uniref:hypothetical protein n=1 Tax=Antarcticibacterium sp. 1MA-6-2 TaxID=2908210 RepID=UPI001F3B3336|nr:hypothetical protein [Antarcticibacterium sp. 1MA-6-2]UJH92663.1 hypothetical protein LZ575_09440 [Antarcticibacterium sp. 1MA-6-2]